jgi:hypothetical protein
MLDGVRFHYFHAMFTSMPQCGVEKLLGDACSPQPTQDEEAGNGPDSVIGRIIADQASKRGTRSNGAPCDRLLSLITQQPNWYSRSDALLHGSLSARSIKRDLVRSRSPRHAPAIVRAAFSLKQSDEIVPASGIYCMECEPAGGASSQIITNDELSDATYCVRQLYREETGTFNGVKPQVYGEGRPLRTMLIALCWGGHSPQV